MAPKDNVVPVPSLWRHNGCESVSNHQPHDCLLNRLFRRRSKKTSKLRVTGPCARNSPETGEFPAQMASNAENVSIWWRHHVWEGYFFDLGEIILRIVKLFHWIRSKSVPSEAISPWWNMDKISSSGCAWLLNLYLLYCIKLKEISSDLSYPGI